MWIKISKLHKSRKYHLEVPRPTQEDYDRLEKSLINEGQHSPIFINKDRVILDGYTRIEILEKNGIDEVLCEIKEFKTKLDEWLFVIDINLARRHLNQFQIGRLLLGKLKIEKKIAAIRQRELGKTHGTQTPSVSFETKGRATQIVADESKEISSTSLWRVAKIMESNDKDLIADAEAEKISINAAYNKVTMKRQPKKDPPMPDDVFNVVYIDPPWGYSNQVTGGSGRSGARQKYPTLTPKQLMEKAPKWKKHFAKNCIMFMWAVTPLGKECQEVLESCGFKYKTKLYWIKDGEEEEGKLGMGYYFRGQVEELLVGIKGSVKAFRIQKRNYIFAKAGPHSEKPEAFRELIEEAAKKVFKTRKQLEMFARKTVPDWTPYGIDVLMS